MLPEGDRQQEAGADLEGGETEEGKRATASHTASLAESPVVWDALIKQCGAIKVNSLDEMIDTMKALLYTRPTTGNRAGLAAMTGGQSVVITDTFAKEGLEVPLLSERSYQEFATFFDIIGSSYRNPLDISSNMRSLETIIRCLDILDQDEWIDSVVLEINVGFLTRIMDFIPSFLDEMMEELTRYRARCNKAFIVILIPGPAEGMAMEVRQRLVERGIASFPSFERGARALKKVVEYHRLKTL